MLRQTIPNSGQAGDESRIQRLRSRHSDCHFKACVDGNLRLEKFRHRTTNLSRLNGGLECRLDRTRYLSCQIEMALRDRECSPTFSKVMVAVAASFSGLKPTLPNCEETAIAKHAACAAASSSSGWYRCHFQIAY